MSFVVGSFLILVVCSFSFKVGQDRLCLTVILKFNNFCLEKEEEPNIVFSKVNVDKVLVADDVWEAIQGLECFDLNYVKKVFDCAEKMRKERLKEMAKVKAHGIRDLENVSFLKMGLDL